MGIIRPQVLCNVAFHPAGGAMFASPLEDDVLARILLDARMMKTFIELQVYEAKVDQRNGTIGVNDQALNILGIDGEHILVYSISKLIRSPNLQIAHTLPPTLDRTTH
jgi:hypothetical protein